MIVNALLQKARFPHDRWLKSGVLRQRYFSRALRVNTHFRQRLNAKRLPGLFTDRFTARWLKASVSNTAPAREYL